MTDETAKRPAEATTTEDLGKREERSALTAAVNALDGKEGQRPEPLRQFAQSAREGEGAPKELQADAETAPRPTSNKVKHKVATRLLQDGAVGEHPDPRKDGVDALPDRIVDRG